MDPRMIDWITTGERPLPQHVISFAKSASGGGKSKRRDDDDDEEDDEEEDDDEEDDEEDDEDDDLADLSDDELRAELKKAKASLSKAGGSVASKRKKIRTLQRELDEEKRKPKAAAKKRSKDDEDDEDAPDLDLIRAEARKEGIALAKKSEARAALIAAGVSRERVARAVGLLDLDELDLDDEGLDGIDEAIDALKGDVPELFATKRRRRGSVAGDGDRDGSKASSRKSKMTPSERQAAAATGKR